tara:strand:+ start:911 stop:1507 length:597 start_codon:yes stop_codon:yes gene_type:complete
MATLNATNLKHASSSSNNIVLASDGSTTISNLANRGKLLQAVYFNKTDASSMSMTETFTDVTGFSLSITPTATNSKIILQGVINYSCEDHYSYGKFVRSIDGGSYADVTNWIGDAASNRIRSMTGNAESHTTYDHVNIPIYAVDDSHNTTNAITYKLQYRGSFNHLSIVGYFNRSETDADSNNGSRAVSHLTLMEIAA